MRSSSITKKSVGQYAYELQQSPYHQEVGETMVAMAQEYDKEMRKTLEANRNVDPYYIVVLRKKDPLMVNVLRQWFVAPRIEKPSAKTLKTDYPLHDIDLWHVVKGDPRHEWTLPGPDALSHILKNPQDHDPKLVGWLRDYCLGKMD